jgi:hypothetical protein
MPEKISGNAVILENGVDGAGTITVNYANMQGELMYSKITNSRIPSQIQGENGCMIIKEIHDTRNITIMYNDGQEEYIEINKHDNNMYYEVEEFIRLILTKESAQKHNQYSLMELSIMNEVRKQIEIKFQADI